MGMTDQPTAVRSKPNRRMVVSGQRGHVRASLARPNKETPSMYSMG